MDNNHSLIHEKLNTFINTKRIPNIVFHGENGSGKHTILKNFVNKIYNNDKEIIVKYVMHVNCSHGKGIKFIREELKLFSKSNINTKEGHIFKTIILLNADKLTTDAQSALRRCIESFTHTTRFFIVINDKNRLLKPILSRFCEIYIPKLITNSKEVNLHKQNDYLVSLKKKRNLLLKKILGENKKETFEDIISLTNELYNNSFACIDIINYIKSTNTINECKKIEYIICFNKVKQEFRNEKLLLLFILNFLYLRSNYNLENISFM